MGLAQGNSHKLENMDLLFVGISLKVEVSVPTSDPLLFDYTQRRKYGCKHITAVKPGGSRTVIIHAQDCTPYEAAEEYRKIVNITNGYGEEQD